MKIAWISSWPPRWCPVANYSEEIVSNLRKNIQVEVISHNDAGRTNETHLWPVIDLENADWFRKLDSVIERIKPDVIILQLDFASFGYQPKATHFSSKPADSFGILETLFRSQIKNIPVIINYHNLIYPLSNQQKQFYNLITKLSQLNIVFSKEQKQILEKLGINKNRILIIPASSEINDRYVKEHLRQKWNLDNSKVIVGLIGWWEPYKNFDFILNIWPKIIKKNPNSQLVIAGIGRPGDLESIQYENKLMDQLNKFRNFPEVKLLARTFDNSEFDEIIASLDILILPYNECAQSLILAKAYANGISVLAANIGGLKSSILSSKAGILTNMSKQSFLNNLSAMISDSNLRQKLAIKGKEYIKRNSIDKITGDYIKAFNNAKKMM